MNGIWLVRSKRASRRGGGGKRGVHLFSLLMALVVIGSMAAVGAPAVLAQGEIVAPQYTEPTWQATYWNNPDLLGYPVFWRSETSLNYDWGAGSPDPRINVDNFSARWSRYIDFGAGTYRFTATSDDGVRVWLDGQLLINGWYDHAPTTFTADTYVSSGEHYFLVEYYERGGGAMINVSWQAIGQPGPNVWEGSYFNNMFLGGSPALVRSDASINFDWGYGSPAPGLVGYDNFSVRWVSQLSLAAGTYRFAMTVDDGGRLWVNNALLIDQWHDSAATTYTADVYVAGGLVPVRMEYYENMGVAVAQLTWTPVTLPPPPPPGNEVIVDDGGSGFIKGGSPTGWHVAYTGYNGELTWTRNNDFQRPNYDWARWYPVLQPGWYEVFVYIPQLYSTTQNAQYWVSHYDGFTRRVVDQSANGGRWVSLGTYRFRGNTQDYVSLNDITYEPYLSRLIGFDAVKWVPR